MALGAVTARSRDSLGCGSGADRSRRGGVDGCDLRRGAFQSPAVHRGFGPLRDGAAVLRLAPAPVRPTRGGLRCFHSDFPFGAGLGLLLQEDGGGGGNGGGERGGPGAGILTYPLRKTEVASRNPTCLLFSTDGGGSLAGTQRPGFLPGGSA